MNPIQLVAYAADVAILGGYVVMNRTGRGRLFNWANCLGALPVGATEVWAGAWQAFILTVAFGLIGGYGLLKGCE